MKRRVIIVTDGDEMAQKAVEKATSNIGGCTISYSAGNPTPLMPSEVLDMIKDADHDPVVVMVDDCGESGIGKGEKIIKAIADDPGIEIMGVVAVASNTFDGEGIDVDFSVNEAGEIVENAVDKYGVEKTDKTVKGDTLSILKTLNVPVIVGMGDCGKMNYKDSIDMGAPVTTKAFREIIKRSRSKI